MSTALKNESAEQIEREQKERSFWTKIKHGMNYTHITKPREKDRKEEKQTCLFIPPELKGFLLASSSMEKNLC